MRMVATVLAPLSELAKTSCAVYALPQASVQRCSLRSRLGHLLLMRQLCTEQCCTLGPTHRCLANRKVGCICTQLRYLLLELVVRGTGHSA